MAQFTVYRNANAATRKAFPFLLDIQTDLVAELATRVVVPLCPHGANQAFAMQTLTPTLDIDGSLYLMLTPQLAGVAKKALGKPVADLSARRAEIVAAIDLLVTGI